MLIFSFNYWHLLILRNTRIYEQNIINHNFYLEGKYEKILIVVCILLMISSFAFGGNSINVNVDGNQLNFDVQPTIVDGRTLVPVRAIFESLGFEVTWQAESKTVVGTKNDLTIELPINSTIAKKERIRYSAWCPSTNHRRTDACTCTFHSWKLWIRSWLE